MNYTTVHCDERKDVRMSAMLAMLCTMFFTKDTFLKPLLDWHGTHCLTSLPKGEIASFVFQDMKLSKIMHGFFSRHEKVDCYIYTPV